MKVKFRESSELSLLQGAEQSGGEKAVSTAAFVLALQSFDDKTAMPFTCVDEINAGMDGEKQKEIILHTDCIYVLTVDIFAPFFFQKSTK